MVQPKWVTGRLQPEPFFSRFLYDTILKRSSTYMTAVMITATVTGTPRTHLPVPTRPRPVPPGNHRRGSFGHASWLARKGAAARMGKRLAPLMPAPRTVLPQVSATTTS